MDGGSCDDGRLLNKFDFPQQSEGLLCFVFANPRPDLRTLADFRKWSHNNFQDFHLSRSFRRNVAEFMINTWSLTVRQCNQIWNVLGGVRGRKGNNEELRRDFNQNPDFFTACGKPSDTISFQLHLLPQPVHSRIPHDVVAMRQNLFVLIQRFPSRSHVRQSNFLVPLLAHNLCLLALVWRSGNNVNGCLFPFCKPFLLIGCSRSVSRWKIYEHWI